MKRASLVVLLSVFLTGCGEARYRGQPQSHWVRQLHDGDEAARTEAGVALGKIGKPALPPLRQALHDPDPVVRKTAADALRRMGEDAEVALPALTELLRDPDPHVRASAAHAI